MSKYISKTVKTIPSRDDILFVHGKSLFFVQKNPLIMN